MGTNFWLMIFSILVGAFPVLSWVLRRFYEWLHESKLGEKKSLLPPGDMGWPLIGNMWFFLSAFKSKDPDSFINGFVKRFGRIRIYKAFMFGSSTIMITTLELCKQVLMDDENFGPGWPQATVELIGKKVFYRYFL